MHLFVDNLTNVDFSYLDPKRGLVGETWLASIVLEGALDEQGMVCDFGIVKKTLRNWLDDTIDHSLVIAKQSSKLTLKQNDEVIDVSWSYSHIEDETDYSIDCTAPSEAITLIDSDIVTPESVATWCIDQLRALLPDTIGNIQLTFTPEHIADHSYHYSHGLKKHNGNCQRIAHGHRSKILITQNGETSAKWQSYWAKRWSDIYIGSNEDVVNAQELSFPMLNMQPVYCFKYEASQGMFEMAIAQQVCELIDYDSTVECLAQHILEQTQRQTSDSLTVMAFEGVGKGAIISGSY